MKNKKQSPSKSSSTKRTVAKKNKQQKSTNTQSKIPHQQNKAMKNKKKKTTLEQLNRQKKIEELRKRRHASYALNAQKDEKKQQKWYHLILPILLLLLGLLLIFHQPIKNFLLTQISNQYSIAQVTPEEIESNQANEASYDFNAVESVDFKSVINARLNPEQVSIVGGIAIPTVNLNLPILLGLSNYAVMVGAGTMKEEQKMGENNYALASHHMIQPEKLFGPLTEITLGDKIYLTDLNYIYTYKTTYKEYVPPNRIDLIDDVPNEKLVTLVTCDATGANRLVVQGQLLHKTSQEKASQQMIEAFDIETNTY